MQNILFDLDGTLLPMNQKKFVTFYLPLLAEKMKKYDISTNDLISAVWKGFYAMVANDGHQTNEDAFWEAFDAVTGWERTVVEPDVTDFYQNEFNQAVVSTDPTGMAAEIIHTLKEQGKKIYLATNPVFPECATMNRIKWAGLDASDFEAVTTYENSHYCKPNVKYFEEVLRDNHLNPKECLMVGNDVKEDLAAGQLGIKTWLVTDCLEHGEGLDLTKDVKANYQSTLEELLETCRRGEL